MYHLFWRVLGAQRILTTNLPQYRRAGQIVALTGRQYRITHTRGWDVWAIPVRLPRRSAQVLEVESPIKHMRQLHERAAPSSSLT